MKPLVFIDGEAGTTGLQIFNRLSGRSDIDFITLGEEDRKSPSHRNEAINSCDLAVLCLPDPAAKEAVSFIRNPKVRVLDASSAHRNVEGWIYGFPEMEKNQSQLIAQASRVSNPGCYPTGAVALLRPLVDAELIPQNYPVNVHAISGYSGSGKSLIDAYENTSSPNYTTVPYRGYGLDLEHKHTAEIEKKSRLAFRPIFTPGYAKYRQGIVLYVPIHLRLLKDDIKSSHLLQALQKHYQGSRFIRVADEVQTRQISQVEPESLNNTNNMQLYVFGNDKYDQALLVAVYDNLGKGASGAAVQNLEIMLNLPASENRALVAHP